jgi:hypothetical protein
MWNCRDLAGSEKPVLSKNARFFASSFDWGSCGVEEKAKGTLGEAANSQRSISQLI